MLPALINVVRLIDQSVGVSIEEARVPIDGDHVFQVPDIVARAKVEFLREGFTLFGSGDQVKVSLVIILVAQGKPVNFV